MSDRSLATVSLRWSVSQKGFFLVVYGETGSIGNGDYEQEIRSAIRARGIDPAPFFPSHHLQSLVVGRRKT
jgi:Predicted subunit of tRNA(5-methylaminomethyl-2-thiouridylate) methyltransferase, contains the PP-loop ATPase domain